MKKILTLILSLILAMLLTACLPGSIELIKYDDTTEFRLRTDDREFLAIDVEQRLFILRGKYNIPFTIIQTDEANKIRELHDFVEGDSDREVYVAEEISDSETTVWYLFRAETKENLNEGENDVSDYWLYFTASELYPNPFEGYDDFNLEYWGEKNTMIYSAFNILNFYEE